MADVEIGNPLPQGRRGQFRRLLASGESFLFPLQRGFRAGLFLRGVPGGPFLLLNQAPGVVDDLGESRFHFGNGSPVEQDLALLAPGLKIAVDVLERIGGALSLRGLVGGGDGMTVDVNRQRAELLLPLFRLLGLVVPLGDLLPPLVVELNWVGLPVWTPVVTGKCGIQRIEPFRQLTGEVGLPLPSRLYGLSRPIKSGLRGVPGILRGGMLVLGLVPGFLGVVPLLGDFSLSVLLLAMASKSRRASRCWSVNQTGQSAGAIAVSSAASG
jgi:hypothetical protein